MLTSSNVDEDWTKTTDVAERRRIQNRLAQRNYRNNIKQRLRQLEWLDDALSKGVDLNVAATLAQEENEENEMSFQPSAGTYQAPQPVMAQPDTNCYWLGSQNEMSVSGHTETAMDNLTLQQDIYGANRPQSHQAQHPQYDNFPMPAEASSTQASTATLTYDRPASGHSTPHQSYHRSRTTSSLTPAPQIDPALASQYQAPSVQMQATPAYKVPTPSSTSSDKDLNHRRTVTPSLAQPSIPTTHTLISSSTGPSTPAGGTPLHVAAQHGHASIVRFLLSKGAKLDAPNEAGQTVLHLAAERGHEAVMEFVLSEAMALGQSQGDAGQQGMGNGTGNAGSGMMGTVAAMAGLIDRVDGQGFTALHLAAANGFEECVRILVEAGAEIEARDRASSGKSSQSSF